MSNHKILNVSLLILPSLFVLIACFFHFNHGNFYQLASDPEYSILFNGAVIGRGSLAINFIDHPATPLIYISGFAIRIDHLFTGSESYVVDFLKNAEKYMHVASILNMLVIAFMAFWSSKKLLGLNKGFWLAILIQIGLFTNASFIEISARLIPESTMIIPVILLCVLLIKHIKGAKEINHKRTTWQFAAIIAFGIACKLSFAPMLLLPLILYRKNLKALSQLTGKTILLTCIFAYPLITNPSESIEWISNMLLHSGKHGTGASDFINTTDLISNIGILLKRDTWFWILLVGQFALSYTSKNQRLKEASLAITISLIAILFFTLKHFAIHYIMPFYAFKTLFVVFIILALEEKKYIVRLNQFNQKIKIATAVLLMALIIPQFIEAKNHYRYLGIRKAQENLIQQEVLRKITDKDLPLIVDAPYWGTPFPEYAKAYGFMNTHRRKTTFKDELRVLHPNFYCYVPWSEDFNHWDKFVGFDYILNQSKSCYLYTNQKIGSYKRIVSRLEKSNPKHEIELLFENTKTGESLLLISVQ